MRQGEWLPFWPNLSYTWIHFMLYLLCEYGIILTTHHADIKSHSACMCVWEGGTHIKMRQERCVGVLEKNMCRHVWCWWIMRKRSMGTGLPHNADWVTRTESLPIFCTTPLYHCDLCDLPTAHAPNTHTHTHIQAHPLLDNLKEISLFQ